MDKKTEKKLKAEKEQLKDRALIAKGKAQLAKHQAEAQMDEWSDIAKDKAQKAVTSAKKSTTKAVKTMAKKGTSAANKLIEKIEEGANMLNEKLD